MDKVQMDLAKVIENYFGADAGYLDIDCFTLARRIMEAGWTKPVRCKDCKHWKPSGSMAGNSEDDLQPIGGCKWANCCRKANDFCSYGERRNDG